MEVDLDTFNVGDTVTVKPGYDYKLLGEKAVIVKFLTKEIAALRFDKNLGLHSCNNLVTEGHGWNVCTDNLILIDYQGSDQIIDSIIRETYGI